MTISYQFFYSLDLYSSLYRDILRERIFLGVLCRQRVKINALKKYS